MIQRKVQLIAGTTCTVSLPKEWTKKNNIGQKSTVYLEEDGRGVLGIYPEPALPSPVKDSISINIDEQEGNVSHMLFASYYMGIENIRLFSKKQITNNTRNKVKRTIRNLSGAEIVFEDLSHIDVKILLDITKTNISQLLYRTNILIGLCIDSILQKRPIEELIANEEETDRIYHLITKMIFLASKDPAILQSSGIKDISYIIHYSTIGKTLESIADSLTDLGKYRQKGTRPVPKMDSVLRFFAKRLSRNASILIKGVFIATHEEDMTEISKIRKEIDSIDEPDIRLHLLSIAHNIVEVEESLMNLGYYIKFKQQE
jgi:phosphate uptake regulator